MGSERLAARWVCRNDTLRRAATDCCIGATVRRSQARIGRLAGWHAVCRMGGCPTTGEVADSIRGGMARNECGRVAGWITQVSFIPIHTRQQMRTTNWALKGKGVPSHLEGKVVRIRIADTPDERLTLAGGDESNVTAKFNDGYVIAAQARGRRAAGKDGATLESVQAILDGYVYEVRPEGTGVARQAKPETQQARIAADQANANFERALQDTQFRDRGIKFGFIDEAKFNAWIEQRQAAQAAKDAAATPATK